MVESNRLLIYRTIFCTQGSNPCFSFLKKKRKKIDKTENFQYLLYLEERKLIGIVAQLVRVPPCHGGCCEFESRQSRFQTNLIIIFLDIIIKLFFIHLELLTKQILVKDLVES